jgi:hypothetical protein
MTTCFSRRTAAWAALALLAASPLRSATIPGVRAFPESARHERQDQVDRRAMPANSRAFGLFYGDWSARWWQWAFSMPISEHPLFGTADCSAGQSGRVWFLGGGPSPRPACVVPRGVALFLPIINAECSNLEGNGNTDAELRSCAKSLADLISTDPDKLYATLDGIRIVGLKHLRVQSPLCAFGPLPPDNFVQYFCGESCAPAGSTGISVSDGYYLLLPPLPPGSHTLHFHGEVPDFDFAIDMTYNLVVER